MHDAETLWAHGDNKNLIYSLGTQPCGRALLFGLLAASITVEVWQEISQYLTGYSNDLQCDGPVMWIALTSILFPSTAVFCKCIDDMIDKTDILLHPNVTSFTVHINDLVSLYPKGTDTLQLIPKLLEKYKLIPRLI